MVVSHRIVRVMQAQALRIRRVPLGITLTGHLRQTVAGTIPAGVRVLTPPQAADIPLQAVRTRRRHTLRRRLAMDRLAGRGLQAAAVAVAEAEADQDRTAAKGQPQFRTQVQVRNEKGPLFERAFLLFVNAREIFLSSKISTGRAV